MIYKFHTGRVIEKRGIKNEGWSHDVDENKQFNFLGHDMYENKGTCAPG